MLPFEDCTLDNIDTFYIGFDDLLEENKDNPNATFISLSILLDNDSELPGSVDLAPPGSPLPNRPPLLLKMAVHREVADLVEEVSSEAAIRNNLIKPILNSVNVTGHHCPKPVGLFVMLTPERPVYDIFNTSLYDSSVELRKTCSFPTPLITSSAGSQFFPVRFDSNLNCLPENPETFFSRFSQEEYNPLWFSASPNIYPGTPGEYVQILLPQQHQEGGQ